MSWWDVCFCLLKRRVAALENASAPNFNSPVFPLTAMEDNGTLATNRMDLSFGNGNEHGGLNAGGWGFPVPAHPFDSTLRLEIVALAFSCRTATDGNGNEVELTVNTDPSTTTNHVRTGFKVSILPNSRFGQSTGSLIVNAGSVVNVITNNPGGGDLVITPWARWIT